MKRLLVIGILPATDVPRCAALAAFHDVTLLSYVPAGWREEIVEHSPRFREHRLPRGESYARHYMSRGEPAADRRRIAIARSAPADEALRRAFFRHSEGAGAIVHTTAVLFDIDERCGVDAVPRFYAPDSGPFSPPAFPIHCLESRLVAASTRIVAAAEPDRRAFQQWYDCPPDKFLDELGADLAYEPVPDPARRRHVILVNDYRIDVQGGGGHVRLRELYGAAASEALELTLICFRDEAGRGEMLVAPHFRQIVVPKTPEHLQLQLSVDALHHASAADVVALVCCASNEALEGELRAALATADIVIFEHVYMAPLAGLVPAGVPVIYAAQNVESLLKQRVLASHPRSADLTEAVYAAEAELVRSASAIVCVSSEDAEEFRTISDKPLHVVENGVVLSGGSAPAERKGALFLGSGHPPNVEALEFILSRVAPGLPDVPFYILGSVCDRVFPGSVPPNVTLCGVVDDARKTGLLHTAALGLNPMFSGSGSNLKLPEYFAAKLPAVATPVGARGFDVADGVHLRIAGPDRFVEAVRELLADPGARCRMSETAYRYACSRLSWDALGGRLRDILTSLLPAGERALNLREEAEEIVVTAGDTELRFPLGPRYSPDYDWPEPPASGDFASGDPVLRSCTPLCPELERFVSLYGGFADRVVIHGGPCSAVRRAARLLPIADVD